MSECHLLLSALESLESKSASLMQKLKKLNDDRIQLLQNEKELSIAKIVLQNKESQYGNIQQVLSTKNDLNSKYQKVFKHYLTFLQENNNDINEKIKEIQSSDNNLLLREYVLNQILNGHTNCIKKDYKIIAQESFALIHKKPLCMIQQESFMIHLHNRIPSNNMICRNIIKDHKTYKDKEKKIEIVFEKNDKQSNAFKKNDCIIKENEKHNKEEKEMNNNYCFSKEINITIEQEKIVRNNNKNILNIQNNEIQLTFKGTQQENNIKTDDHKNCNKSSKKPKVALLSKSKTSNDLIPSINFDDELIINIQEPRIYCPKLIQCLTPYQNKFMQISGRNKILISAEKKSQSKNSVNQSELSNLSITQTKSDSIEKKKTLTPVFGTSREIACYTLQKKPLTKVIAVSYDILPYKNDFSISFNKNKKQAIRIQKLKDLSNSNALSKNFAQLIKRIFTQKRKEICEMFLRILKSFSININKKDNNCIALTQMLYNYYYKNILSTLKLLLCKQYETKTKKGKTSIIPKSKEKLNKSSSQKTLNKTKVSVVKEHVVIHSKRNNTENKAQQKIHIEKMRQVQKQRDKLKQLKVVENEKKMKQQKLEEDLRKKIQYEANLKKLEEIRKKKEVKEKIKELKEIEIKLQKEDEEKAKQVKDKEEKLKRDEESKIKQLKEIEVKRKKKEEKAFKLKKENELKLKREEEEKERELKEQEIKLKKEKEIIIRQQKESELNQKKEEEVKIKQLKDEEAQRKKEEQEKAKVFLIDETKQRKIQQEEEFQQVKEIEEMHLKQQIIFNEIEKQRQELKQEKEMLEQLENEKKLIDSFRHSNQPNNNIEINNVIPIPELNSETFANNSQLNLQHPFTSLINKQLVTQSNASDADLSSSQENKIHVPLLKISVESNVIEQTDSEEEREMIKYKKCLLELKEMNEEFQEMKDNMKDLNDQLKNLSQIH